MLYSFSPAERRHIAAAVVAVCIVLAIAFPPLVVSADQDDPPGLPASYYGDITINDEQAPDGTEIKAVVDGDVRGSIVVDQPGEYGGPAGGDDKLTVDGEEGATVTFRIIAEGYESGTADQTSTLAPGTITELNLTATLSEQSESDSTPGGTSGGGGGGGGAPEEDQEGNGEDSEETEEPTGENQPTQVEQAEITVDEETGQSQVRFTEESDVESITFDEGGTEGSVTVATYDSEPESTGSAPGETVSVTQIDVPDPDQSATIRHRVSRDRVEKIDAGPNDLQINRFDETAGEWQSLDTEIADSNENRIILSAQTQRFSFFSVSAVSEPTASFTVFPEQPTVNSEITLNASNSRDRYGEIVSYEWTIGGITLFGEKVTLKLDEPGEYSIELTVENDAGERNSSESSISLSEATASDTPITGETTPTGTLNPDDDTTVEGTTETETGASGPGFGIFAALTGVFISVVIARRKTGSDRRK